MIARLLAWWWSRPDPAWPGPTGISQKPEHEHFDPELRARTIEKRKREDQLRKDAAHVASSPAPSEAARPLRMVAGGDRG
mgnify:CR=1 FL=1